MKKEIGITAATINLLAIIMLLMALFGDPPYGFFAPLKWIVAAASAFTAWQILKLKPWTPALSAALVVTGIVELTGKFRREEWVPWNWASIILLAAASGLILYDLKVAGAKTRGGQ